MGLLQDLVYGAAKRWISGKDMEAALANAKEANRRGLGAILNYLGEDVANLDIAARHADEYLKLQRAIGDAKVDGCVSVKLTQFGLQARESFAVEQVERLAQAAESLGQTLWIDMESSRDTAKTLRIYTDVLQRHKSVGLAMQAYLKRSEQDLNALLDLGGKVRLVKGAYREPPEIAFRSRREVTENYLRLMRTLFQRGEGFAVATHDSRLIDEARALSESHGTKFEFQMLRGIREDLQLDLARSGYRVVEYMPYGEDWYGYSMRRIREHPSNIWLLIRSL